MMEIYNEQMERMETADLTLGWLEETQRELTHDAVDAIEEIWHYEIIAQYPNGGRDVLRVIDRAGVKAKDAWTEMVPIQIYHPYTREELEQREAQMNRPSIQEQLDEMRESIGRLHDRIEGALDWISKTMQTKEAE